MEQNFQPEEKAAFFDTIIGNEYEWVCRIDLDSGTSTTVFARDKFFSSTLGITSDYEQMMHNYLLGASVDPDVQDVMQKMGVAAIRTALKEMPFYHVLYTVRAESGSFQIKEATFLRAKESLLALFVRDITKMVTAATRTVQALDSAMQGTEDEINKRNSFLTMMSRNIRTPLYSIIGLTKLVQENHPADAAIDSYLHKIAMSGSYMNTTIDDVLDLRRITKHDIMLRPERIDMKEFVQAIDHSLRPRIEGQGLLFQIDASEIEDLTLNTDRHCLTQIVSKLLLSAASYTVKGGRINLIMREQYRTNDSVSMGISVESVGVVIDPERVQSMFQTYDYVRDKIDSDIGSLDIALIILKNYAMALGTYSITAETDESKGTRVSLTLQLPVYADKNSKKSGQSQNGEGPDLSGTRVLLVDDNDINLEIGVKLLKAKDMDVVIATDGVDAVSKFEEAGGQFDLILMDILMPRMGGLEATRKIRAMDIPSAKSIPIIAMTVNAFKENIEENFRAGLNAHLIKPIDPARLYRVIAESLHLN